jgi:hypothetical protein
VLVAFFMLGGEGVELEFCGSEGVDALSMRTPGGVGAIMSMLSCFRPVFTVRRMELDLRNEYPFLLGETLRADLASLVLRSRLCVLDTPCRHVRILSCGGWVLNESLRLIARLPPALDRDMALAMYIELGFLPANKLPVSSLLFRFVKAQSCLYTRMTPVFEAVTMILPVE